MLDKSHIAAARNPAADFLNPADTAARARDASDRSPESAARFADFLREADRSAARAVGSEAGRGVQSRDADFTARLELARADTAKTDSPPPATPQAGSARPLPEAPSSASAPVPRSVASSDSPQSSAAPPAPTATSPISGKNIAAQPAAPKTAGRSAAPAQGQAADSAATTLSPEGKSSAIARAGKDADPARGSDSGMASATADQPADARPATPDTALLAAWDVSRLISNVTAAMGSASGTLPAKRGNELTAVSDAVARANTAATFDSAQAAWLVPLGGTDARRGPVDSTRANPAEHDLSSPNGLSEASGRATDALAGLFPREKAAPGVAATGSDLTGSAIATTASTSAFADSLRTAEAPTDTLSTPLHSAQWKDELGAAVVRLADNGQSEARLKLNPEHLGPIDISIDMNGSIANIQFTADSPEARHALEQALPHLSQMMSDSGLSLGHAAVGREPHPDTSGNGADASFASSRGPQRGAGKDGQENGDPLAAMGPATGLRRLAVRPGGVDTFA
jgi:flagellar hook-length control protein FliK